MGDQSVQADDLRAQHQSVGEPATIGLMLLAARGSRIFFADFLSLTGACRPPIAERPLRSAVTTVSTSAVAGLRGAVAEGGPRRIAVVERVATLPTGNIQ